MHEVSPARLSVTCDEELHDIKPPSRLTRKLTVTQTRVNKVNINRKLCCTLPSHERIDD